jgi:4a-hydroxytetrahydrobiopterin dehydratase
MNLTSLRCSTEHMRSPLADATRQQLLATLPDWQAEGIELVKTFKFTNYHEVMAFVNALAWIAHQEDHHPDLSVHYNRVVVRFSSHDAGALTLNDFICAAKAEALTQRPAA